MLYFPQTRVENSTNRAVANGFRITAEGAALVGVIVAGLYGVKMAAGSGSERFQGVSVDSVTDLTSAPKYETGTIGSGAAVILGAEPLAGTVRVVVGSTVLTAAGSADSTHYAVDGSNAKRFIFDNSFVGSSYIITYQYAPTLAQAMALQGNVLPGGPAGQYLGQTGVITRGDVYTDQWDTTADWSTAVGVVLAANGRFAPTATLSSALEGTQLLEAPSATRAILGLNINVVA